MTKAAIPALLCAMFALPACDLPDGYLDDAYFAARKLSYLEYATSVQDSTSVHNSVLHMERERVDESYTAPVGAVGPNDWDANFAKIASLADTSDFTVMYLLTAYLGYKDHPMVDPAIWTKIEDTLLNFKYWYTQPTPDGLTDNMWYWSENHEIIFHTIEYLAGTLFPEEVFTTTGMTGAEHVAHARPKILAWLELRARFGFFEWHSNVYYQFDIMPLITLVEFVDDPEITVRAEMILDTLFYDIAMHTHRGSFGVSRGRTYKKDKMSAFDESIFNLNKMLFDQTSYDYTSTGASSATLVARSHKYQLPEAIWRIARSERSYVDKERMGIWIDEHEAIRKRKPPVPPYEFEFDDEHLPLWWSMSALTVWQVVPTTISVANQYNLWDTELFADYSALEGYKDSAELLKGLAQVTAHASSLALLKEVNSYTYRTPDYMLSTIQDYRKGSRSNQAHSWQATFDENAIVFVTHPGHDVRETLDWRSDGEPGQWTGTATLPRSAQHENVQIHLYSIQYELLAAPLDLFSRFVDYTHAYFPQDHFDEVVRDGHWTFGKAGDGYVALYSWRMPEWIEYDPSVVATRGLVEPFDLRAPGGAQNVWIVECGRAGDWESFEAFRTAIAQTPVDVTDLEDDLPEGVIGPLFDVAYDSPTQGLMEFGWEGPLVIDGEEISISDYPRFDNPWSSAEFLDKNRLVFHKESKSGFAHDFEGGRRWVFSLP